MDSLISGIIDCVARPSTSDSPVRVIRKCSSESPNCISSDPGMESARHYHHHLGAADSESETSFTHNISHRPPAHMRVVSSSSSLSRLMVPGEPSLPINSVLTAEGIIMGDPNERGYVCGAYGDCSATCYEHNNVSMMGGGDDCTHLSSESIDNAVVRQFEAAFATFLYKNPAFNSMSHTTLQKLRAKLLKESAKNIRVEGELRNQLANVREAKHNRGLELQQELLVVTRAKAVREAELVIKIQKMRRSSMMLDEQIKTNDTAATDNAATSWFDGFGFGSSSPPASPSSPQIARSDSYEAFQKEIQKNKMEQAHILAEIEKIKMQIAQDNANGTP